MRENISQKVSYDLVILTINRKSLNGCVMECRLVSMSYFFAMAFIHALLLRAFLCASKTFLHGNNKKEKHGCRPNCAWFNIMEIRVVHDCDSSSSHFSEIRPSPAPAKFLAGFAGYHAVQLQ